MRKYIKENSFFIFIILICLLFSLILIGRRWRTESANKAYNIILDYEELELMAEQSERDTVWWMNQFQDMGINYVGLMEENLTSLTKDPAADVSTLSMSKVMQDPYWKDNYPEPFVREIDKHGYDRYDIIVEASGAAAEFVAKGLEGRLGKPFIHYEETDPIRIHLDGEKKHYFLLDGSINDALYANSPQYVTDMRRGFASSTEIESSKLLYIPLGLMPEKVALIQDAGLEIVPRTVTYDGYNGARFAEDVLDGYQSFGIRPRYILAGGEAVIGADDKESNPLWNYITENDIPLGLIETSVQREHVKQTGLIEMAEGQSYNAVRVFSMWDYVQNRYAYYGYEGPEEIVNELFRAITERNIRVVYFKPIKQHDSYFAYVTDPGVYRDMFESLDARLAPHHIVRGEARSMENIQYHPVFSLPMGIAAGIGGVMLLALLLSLNKRIQFILAAGVTFGVMAFIIIVPNTSRLIISFANAGIFASLAVAFFLRSAKSIGQSLSETSRVREIVVKSVGTLDGALLIALAGAMLTAAPLSSTEYMLEIGIFRGVKLAQMLPLGMFCLLFLASFGLFEKERREDRLQMKDFAGILNWTIPVWGFLLLGVLFMAGRYYLARTGHETSVTVSSVELVLRNILENISYARPRTKEFLIAFPCIMLTVYASVRRMPFWVGLFGLAGTIGMASVINTFEHIRTPLYLGFMRTAGSLVLGTLLGMAYIFIFEFLYKMAQRNQKGKENT